MFAVVWRSYSRNEMWGWRDIVTSIDEKIAVAHRNAQLTDKYGYTCGRSFFHYVLSLVKYQYLLVAT